VLIIFVEQRLTSSAAGIFQGCWLPGAPVDIDPVGDALTSHAEHDRDIGGRASLGKFQNGERAAI
jgi:hypothetical protein